MTSLSFFPPHGVFTKVVPHGKWKVFDTLMSRFTNLYKKLEPEYGDDMKMSYFAFLKSFRNEKCEIKKISNIKVGMSYRSSFADLLGAILKLRMFTVR